MLIDLVRDAVGRRCNEVGYPDFSRSRCQRTRAHRAGRTQQQALPCARGQSGWQPLRAWVAARPWAPWQEHIVGIRA